MQRVQGHVLKLMAEEVQYVQYIWERLCGVFNRNKLSERTEKKLIPEKIVCKKIQKNNSRSGEIKTNFLHIGFLNHYCAFCIMELEL